MEIENLVENIRQGLLKIGIVTLKNGSIMAIAPDDICLNESGQYVISYTGTTFEDFQTRLNHINDKTPIDFKLKKEILFDDVCCFIPFDERVRLMEDIGGMQNIVIPRQYARFKEICELIKKTR